MPRHEKVVAQQLAQKAIETYLPLYETVHRWKDRNARVHLPLFPGYVFVRIPLEEQLRVLTLDSVLRLVSFNGKPAPLADGEVEGLKRFLAVQRAEPWPYLAVGKRVRINSGPLEGLEGRVVRRKGKTRIVVSVDSLMRSIAFEVEAFNLQLAA